MLSPITIRSLVLLGASSLATAGLFAQGAAENKGVVKADPAKASAAAVEEGDKEAAAEEEEETGGLQATKFMPLGRPNLQVKIPQFENGELQCVMRAEEMVRVAEEDIDIKSMDMEFLEDGEAVTRIELLDARYNLTDKLIKTDKRAVVQRADFTLVGSSLEFDTTGQRGKMQGKVRMVIHDSSAFAGKEEQVEELEEESSGDTGLSVVEVARMIARVAEFQSRQDTTESTP